MAAEAPTSNPPDVLIVESTYGMQIHPSREDREKQFIGELLHDSPLFLAQCRSSFSALVLVPVLFLVPCFYFCYYARHRFSHSTYPTCPRIQSHAHDTSPLYL